VKRNEELARKIAQEMPSLAANRVKREGGPGGGAESPPPAEPTAVKVEIGKVENSQFSEAEEGRTGGGRQQMLARQGPAMESGLGQSGKREGMSLTKSQKPSLNWSLPLLPLPHQQGQT
jgi:hypothetical protein